MVATPKQKSIIDGMLMFNVSFVYPVFVGFNVTVDPNSTFNSRLDCAPTTSTYEKAVFFSGLAFVFFVFSTAVTLILKAVCARWTIETRTVRLCVLIAAIASAAAFALLVLGLIHLTEIKVGKRVCGSSLGVFWSLYIFSGAIIVFLILTYLCPLFMEEEEEEEVHAE